MSELHYAPAEPPRGFLLLTGEDRVGFLQGLVSNDVRRVDAGHGIWTALLTPQGKYLFDFFVTALDDALLLDVEAARAGELGRRLSLHRLRAKVAIADAGERFALWQVWGEGVAAAFGLDAPGAAATLAGGTVLADPRLPGLGLRLALPAGQGEALLRERGGVAAPWSEWDRLRLVAGVPDGSRDLVIDKSILLENGFDELNGVAWDKGCYMGQELTARTKYRGLVKKRLMPVRLDGPVPPPGTLVLRPDGSEAGEIRSGAGDRALALIRLDAGAGLTAAGIAVVPEPPGWMAG